MKNLHYLLLIICIPVFATAQDTGASSVTASYLIETIIDKTGAEGVPDTVDFIKEGNADTQVTGIVTCMFATMDVLKKAVEKNCNLIITHEPLYYNHLDSTEQFKNDKVYLAKKKFINDNKLVIWRFHDYIHRMKPDGIMTGMAEKLGWKERQSEDNPYEFSFPDMTLAEILKGMKETFPENGFHVIGDSTLSVSKLALIPGASGTMAHISQLNRDDIDMVVAGEVPQWETYEYVRDAISQGRKKAIVFIGHINSEESGMKFCAEWLAEFISNVPIHFVKCGSSYFTY